MAKRKSRRFFFFQHAPTWSPTWSYLYSISKSKIIRSSYVWFFIVPVFARMLSKIQSTLTIELFGQITLCLRLPFTWQLFFFGATFISLGNLVYVLRCPTILKKYRNFSDFQKEGRTSIQLIEMYMNLIRYRLNSQSEKYQVVKSLQEFYRSYCVKDQAIFDELQKETHRILQTVSRMNVLREMLSGAFIHVQDFGEQSHTKSIRLCFILYGIGIAFISWVFIENVWTVLKLTFSI